MGRATYRDASHLKTWHTTPLVFLRSGSEGGRWLIHFLGGLSNLSICSFIISIKCIWTCVQQIKDQQHLCSMYFVSFYKAIYLLYQVAIRLLAVHQASIGYNYSSNLFILPCFFLAIRTLTSLKLRARILTQGANQLLRSEDSWLQLRHLFGY